MIRTATRNSTRRRIVGRREPVVTRPSSPPAARSDNNGQRTDGRLDEPGSRTYETSYSISTGYTTDRTIVLP